MSDIYKMMSNSTDYYYELIRYFSLSDLKRLMISAHVDRIVKKSDTEKSRSELLFHLRQLLFHNLYPPLKDKIVQFHYERYRHSQSSRSLSRRAYGRLSSNDRRRLSHERPFPPDERQRRRYEPSYSRDQCPRRRQSSRPSYSHDQILSHEASYSNSMNMNNSNSSLQLFDHPHVVFTNIPFFEVMSPLIKPSRLVALRNGQSHKEYRFCFTAEQLNQLQHFSDVQVQLRICPLNEAEEQDDEIPSGISIKVNNHTYLFPPNRSDLSPLHCLKIPIDISQVVIKTRSQVNTIRITWNKSLTKQYILAVHLVKKLSSDCLAQHLCNEKVQSSNTTVELIKKTLNPSNDLDITTEYFDLSMICPLGKNKVKLPCRASTCKHLQCFEASLYLKMNELRAKWICPICNEPALFKDLIVDGLFLEILSKLPEECTEVKFDKDGSWRPSTHTLISKGSPILSKKRKEETSAHLKVPVIELEGDEHIKSTLTTGLPVVSTEKRPTIVFLDYDTPSVFVEEKFGADDLKNTPSDQSDETLFSCESRTNIVHDHAAQSSSSPIVSVIDLDSDSEIELIDSDIELIE